MTKALLKQTPLPPRSLAISYPTMTKYISFRDFKTSPEITQLAVILYVRFPLSLRNVEDLLHERGADVSYESVRYWLHKFGSKFLISLI
jgi:transposase-like protein